MAGSIDFAAQDEHGKLVLFDWKRTKSLPSKFDNVFRNMQPPLHHLPDATGVKYQLQLNVYKAILQKYYKVEVGGMFIVCLHPEHGGLPWVSAVPDMSGEAGSLLEQQRARVRQIHIKDTQCSSSSATGAEVPDGAKVHAAVALHARLPRDLCESVTGMLLNFSRSSGTPAVDVLRGSLAKHILDYVGADSSGFWDIPGPERLCFLCSMIINSPCNINKNKLSHSPDGIVSDVLGGADDDEDFFPGAGEEPAEQETQPMQLSPGSRTAAKSKAKPNAGPDVDAAVQEVKAEEQNEELAVMEGAWETLKRRRFLPDAATSAADFDKLFSDLGNSNQVFQGVPCQLMDTSDTILEKVRAWREGVERTVPDLPELPLRLCMGALAFGRVRQADIHLREHALIYWVAEGQRSLRRLLHAHSIRCVSAAQRCASRSRSSAILLDVSGRHFPIASCSNSTCGRGPPECSSSTLARQRPG